MRYRWAVLAAGTFAQASYTAIVTGIAVLAPLLRTQYDLSLAEVGVLLAAPNLGSIPTAYAWGAVTDRLGERTVVGLGLSLTCCFLAAAAFASSFTELALLLLLAGAAGSSVTSASGRAVMHWFDARQRGLALGVRQTAVPIAGAWAALVLPALTRADTRPAVLALAAGCLAGAVVGVTVLRGGSHPAPASAPPHSARGPFRDRTMWLLAVGGGLMLAPQACLVGFLVLFLHTHRGLSTAHAALVLAAVNVLGIVARIGAGHWSDRIGSRVLPLRRIALGSAVLAGCCTALLSGPLGLLVPLLIAMGCVSISWNGLLLTTAAEVSGYGRSGAAIGFQQMAVGTWAVILPVAFGTFVAAASWRAGYALVALLSVGGWSFLKNLDTPAPADADRGLT